MPLKVTLNSLSLSSKMALVGPLAGHRGRGSEVLLALAAGFAGLRHVVPSVSARRMHMAWSPRCRESASACDDLEPQGGRWTPLHMGTDAKKPGRAFGPHGDTKPLERLHHEGLGVWRGASVMVEPGLWGRHQAGVERAGPQREAGPTLSPRPSLAQLALLILHLFSEPSLRQPLLCKGTFPGLAPARAVLLSRCPAWTWDVTDQWHSKCKT